jgi:phospholipid N-methyltransferase
MSALRFFWEGIKNIRTVGTISRSSSFVSRAMLRQVDFAKADCIVELGAGDGPITKHILERMKPGARLLAFEVNPTLCELLRKNCGDGRLRVIEDSAEHMEKYIREEGFEKADFVISALPFVSLPQELGDSILRKSKECLRLGGKYVQINYSLLARKRYEAIFGNGTVEFVLFNIPPAFITTCTV